MYTFFLLNHISKIYIVLENKDLTWKDSKRHFLKSNLKISFYISPICPSYLSYEIHLSQEFIFFLLDNSCTISAKILVSNPDVYTIVTGRDGISGIYFKLKQYFTWRTLLGISVFCITAPNMFFICAQVKLCSAWPTWTSWTTSITILRQTRLWHRRLWRRLTTY